MSASVRGTPAEQGSLRPSRQDVFENPESKLRYQVYRCVVNSCCRD